MINNKRLQKVICNNALNQLGRNIWHRESGVVKRKSGDRFCASIRQKQETARKQPRSTGMHKKPLRLARGITMWSHRNNVKGRDSSGKAGFRPLFTDGRAQPPTLNNHVGTNGLEKTPHAPPFQQKTSVKSRHALSTPLPTIPEAAADKTCRCAVNKGCVDVWPTVLKKNQPFFRFPKTQFQKNLRKPNAQRPEMGQLETEAPNYFVVWFDSLGPSAPPQGRMASIPWDKHVIYPFLTGRIEWLYQWSPEDDGLAGGEAAAEKPAFTIGWPLHSCAMCSGATRRLGTLSPGHKTRVQKSTNYWKQIKGHIPVSHPKQICLSHPFFFVDKGTISARAKKYPITWSVVLGKVPELHKSFLKKNRNHEERMGGNQTTRYLPSSWSWAGARLSNNVVLVATIQGGTFICGKYKYGRKWRKISKCFNGILSVLGVNGNLTLGFNEYIPMLNFWQHWRRMTKWGGVAIL